MSAVVSLSDPDHDLSDLVDQIFDVLVRDFSAYAVDLHGKASSTKAQQLWALEYVRKPAAGTDRYDRVWQLVLDQTGAHLAMLSGTEAADGTVTDIHELGYTLTGSTWAKTYDAVVPFTRSLGQVWAG